MVRLGTQLIKGKVDVVTTLTNELPSGTQEIGKVWVDEMVTPSDNLKVSADTERGTGGYGSYEKKKEIQLNVRGTVRVKFDLKTANVLATAYGRIFKNGVAVGTEQTNDTTEYVTKTEDIAGWERGDKLQLYLMVEEAYGALAQNLRLYWDSVKAEVLID